MECPNEQPDCVNTPGAYLCLCFEYERETNTCKGFTKDSQLNSTNKSEQIPVKIMPLVPFLPQTSVTTAIKLPVKKVVKVSAEDPSISLTSAVILKPENVPEETDVSDEIQKIPLASFFDALTTSKESLLNEIAQTVRIFTPAPITIRV